MPFEVMSDVLDPGFTLWRNMNMHHVLPTKDEDSHLSWGIPEGMLEIFFPEFE